MSGTLPSIPSFRSEEAFASEIERWREHGELLKSRVSENEALRRTFCHDCLNRWVECTCPDPRTERDG